MRNVLSAIIVAFGILGYLNYMINIKRISMFIAPAVLITTITMAVYCAGLINIMPYCVYLIVIAGIFLLLRNRQSISFSFLRGNRFPVALCILLVAYLLYHTIGGNYADGDTMTHWGVIVKSIYRYNRLPNFLNKEIGYQSYPPATACWIYFIHRLFGYGEGKAMFAQGAWMLACVISLFAANKTRRKTGDLLIFLLHFIY